MRAGITTVLSQLPADLRRTLTWDQDKDLAQHRQITAETGTSVFFCDAHSPWQRGRNENMNGLLRDYFLKRTDLRHATPARVRQVADEISTRPRKTLGWSRPTDLLARHLTPTWTEQPWTIALSCR